MPTMKATVMLYNQHEGDPVFLNPDTRDYHIGPGSAALDAGVEAGVDDDMDADPRPMGHGYDPGADELRVALLVTEQANPDPVQAGEPLTYTLHVTNTGHLTLTATITDTLPNHVTPRGTLRWTPDPISPNEVWTQPMVVTVAECHAGPLTNVVEVTTRQRVTGLYTQTSTSFVIPALNLVKQANLTTTNDGETITYTYTVENIGSTILTDVNVTDDQLGAIGLVTTTLAPDDITTGTAAYVVQRNDLPGPLVNLATATAGPPTGERITDYAIEWVDLISSSITIGKEANVTHTFLFTRNLGTFSLPTGGSQDFPSLAPGDYVVAEDPSSFPTPNWALRSVTCLDEGKRPVLAEADLNNFRAVIPLRSDQHLTCTFLNERADFVYYLPLILKRFRR